MARRDDLLDHVERAARKIERDVDRLRKATSANSERSPIELLRVAATELASSSAELARLAATGAQAEEDDAALLEQIQSRFDQLPRKGSAVDELIAERRLDFWREELESYDQ
ncbi:MAG: hypothetical protein EXR66_08775 [Dehalococcoidia bacterium]|nr:hypothetical protein [Dehalococcoidia bacterium]